MPSFRKLACALLTVAISLAFVAMPVCVTVKGGRAELSVASAFAKDGNSKGGGNGNGSGNGQGGGNGKSGGSDKGKGKGGATGKSEAGGKGSSGAAGIAASVGGNYINSNTGDNVQVSGNKIDVLHRNGMREGIKAGHYTMKDGKGRTIIERRATGADEARLRGMLD